ncbi:hypothetical protein ACTXT7_015378, partial [Hymenolepis weldensis]
MYPWSSGRLPIEDLMENTQWKYEWEEEADQSCISYPIISPKKKQVDKKECEPNRRTSSKPEEFLHGRHGLKRECVRMKIK